MVVRLTEVKPCPCCGAQELLEVGRIDSDRFGVQCRACRLTMARSLPERWPPGCEDRSDVHDWTTNKAIVAWNTRKGS